jgi:two-component system alkaline phosphatase synthesis response regulator PhoP
MANERILVVEDDVLLRRSLTDLLRDEGYSVAAVSDAEAALEHARTAAFDLIVMDVLLPSRSGVEICRELRLRRIQIPILLLTARRQTEDKVHGLKSGADDYVTKPFDTPELLARIEALLRRAARRDVSGVLRVGPVCIDLDRAVVIRSGRPVELSAREWKLLRYFLQHEGTVLSREELLREVWEYRARAMTRAVDLYVAWLRQKIEQDPRHPRLIQTVRGQGYVFKCDNMG